MGSNMIKNSFIWKAINWLNQTYEKSVLHGSLKAVGNFFRKYSSTSFVSHFFSREFVIHSYVEGSVMIKSMKALSNFIRKNMDACITILCLAARNSFVFPQCRKFYSMYITCRKGFEGMVQRSQMRALLMKWLESEQK